MGVITVDLQFTSSIAPNKLFKALYLENQNLIPRMMLRRALEGDSGVGRKGGNIKSVKIDVHRSDGSPCSGCKFNNMNIKDYAFDEQRCSIKFSVFDRNVLGNKLESAAFDVKFEADDKGRSFCKMTVRFHPKGEVEPSEKQIKSVKKWFDGFDKVVEEYLVAFQSAYA